MKTVFGKVIFTVILAFSLMAASCNTNESRKEIRVKEGDDGRTEDVRVKERHESDSASYDREKTIRQDNEGNTKVKEEVDVDVEKDRD